MSTHNICLMEKSKTLSQNNHKICLVNLSSVLNNDLLLKPEQFSVISAAMLFRCNLKSEYQKENVVQLPLTKTNY